MTVKNVLLYHVTYKCMKIYIQRCIYIFFFDDQFITAELKWCDLDLVT